MSNVKPEHVDDEYTQLLDGSLMKKSAAKFLLRALQDLRLVDDTITVDNLQAFAGTIIGEMDLMIGSEEMLRELFDIRGQIDFIVSKNHNRNAEQLSEKILQAQQNLITNDQDFPF